jgi:hypothetical protein
MPQVHRLRLTRIGARGGVRALRCVPGRNRARSRCELRGRDRRVGPGGALGDHRSCGLRCCCRPPPPRAPADRRDARPCDAARGEQSRRSGQRRGRAAAHRARPSRWRPAAPRAGGHGPRVGPGAVRNGPRAGPRSGARCPRGCQGGPGRAARSGSRLPPGDPRGPWPRRGPLCGGRPGPRTGGPQRRRRTSPLRGGGEHGLFRSRRSDDQRRHPDVSPLYADVGGMPPALFAVGSNDHLLDDTLIMAARWEAAGNRCELLVYPDTPYGCIALPTVAGHFFPRLFAFFRRSLDDPAPSQPAVATVN